MQSTIPNFKHLSQVVLQLQIFFRLPMYLYASNPGALVYGHFEPSDLDLNKICKGILGHALKKLVKDH